MHSLTQIAKLESTSANNNVCMDICDNDIMSYKASLIKLASPLLDRYEFRTPSRVSTFSLILKPRENEVKICGFWFKYLN